MQRTFQLDDQDRRLLALLRGNARTSTAELARALRVARMTVVERLKRLEKFGVVAGYTIRLGDEASRGVIKVHALLKADAKQTEHVVRALHQIAQVRAVFAISGMFDYMALIEAEGTSEIDQVLDTIGAITGVEGTQSSIVLSVKFDRH